MTSALSSIRAGVTRGHVLRAVDEYDRLGPEDFFVTHGYGPSRSYELVIGEHRYPHKAILGTAYELATGKRLEPSEFEGGKAGAVAVLEGLDFELEPKA
jgi:5-methylcytosine-specific restriction protein A